MNDDFRLRLSNQRNRTLPTPIRRGHVLRRQGGVTQHVPFAQRVQIKSGSSLGKAPHSWGQYGRGYLMRDGVGKNNEQGLGFNGERNDVDLGKEMSAWQKADDRQYYHLIVSPERSADLDMRQFTKDLMAQMETDLHAKLQWAGIAHYNTHTPHTHVILRGVNEQGEELRLSTNYLYYDLVDRAETLATNALGYRLAQHRIERQEQTLGWESFTEVDRAILARSDSNHQVTLSENTSVQTDQEQRRLAYLKDLGLAKQTGPQSWELYHDLKRELNFRRANREFVAEWRKPPVQEQQQMRQRGLVRAVDEQEYSRERGRSR